MFPCRLVVYRGDSVVYADHEECYQVSFTKVIRTPAVTERVEADGYIAEKLETGDVYVQYRDVYKALDDAFADWEGKHLFLLSGVPRVGKSYAPKFFSLKWGRPFVKLTMADILSMWQGKTEKKIVKYFKWAEENRGVVLFDEGEALAMRRMSAKYYTVLSTLLSASNDISRGVVAITTNAPLYYFDDAVIAAGRFRPLKVRYPTSDMLKTYARLANLQYKPWARTFVDLHTDKPHEIYRKWDFEMLPMWTGDNMGITIDVDTGVYYTYMQLPYVLAALWVAVGGKRPVWYVNGATNVKMTIDLIEEHNAVGVIDDRIVEKYAMSVRPLESGAIVLVISEASRIPFSNRFKELKINYGSSATERLFFEKIYKQFRPCASHTSDMWGLFWKVCK